MSAKRALRSGVFLVADIISLNIALLLTYYIRFELSLSLIPESFMKSLPLVALIATLVKIVTFTGFRLYKSLWRYAGAYEVISVAFASFFANGALLILLVVVHRLTNQLFAPRSIFAITFFLDVFAVGGVRLLYRSYRRYITGTSIQMDRVRRVLIIGAGDAGAIMAKEMRNHPELYRKAVAFLDTDPYKFGRKLNGIPIAGPPELAEKITREKDIHEIIIAMPGATSDVLNTVYAECAKTSCKIRILPSMVEILDETVVMQKLKDVDIEDLLGRAPIRLDTSEIAEYLVDQVVMVTGGGGSIGSELSRQISEYHPNQLILLDNYENGLYDIEQELKLSHPDIKVICVIANVRDRSRLNDVFSAYHPNIVFHAAAHKHVPLMENNPSEALKNNVFGTWNVAHCAAESHVSRFVLISTDKAVNPTNVMGASKRLAEMIVQAMNPKFDTEFVAVRFGNVLGSNGSVIPLFKKQIAAGGPIRVTHQDVTRFFMTIPEAVQLVLQAGGMAKGGEIFILDMGKPIRIYDLAINLIRLSGYRPHEDIPIEIVGLRPGEKLYEELMLAEEGTNQTKYPKIHIARQADMDYNHTKEWITKLEGAIDQMDNSQIKEFILSLVPNYRPMQND